MALATALRDLKGRFVLSINDTPEVRETFAAFLCERVGLRYSIAGGKGTRASELIISG
jgi:DNA adenine methylase